MSEDLHTPQDRLASTAEKMARFARRLRDCPVLRAAVRDGDVTVRQAEAVLPLARGEAESYWVERARKGDTVRELKAAVKRAGGTYLEEAEEEWNRLCVEVPPE